MQNVKVYFGNGDGTFLFPTDYTVGQHPISVISADFNNDQKVDLAEADLDDNVVTTL